jgi:hypothetical protein
MERARMALLGLLLLLFLPPYLSSPCSALMSPVAWLQVLATGEGCCCSVRHGLLPAAGATLPTQTLKLSWN